jgi:hypothetical protein
MSCQAMNNITEEGQVMEETFGRLAMMMLSKMTYFVIAYILRRFFGAVDRDPSSEETNGQRNLGIVGRLFEKRHKYSSLALARIVFAARWRFPLR